MLSCRSLNVRHRDRIVEAWANDDDAALDDAWVSDAGVDLGSEWGDYEYAASIGFRCLRSALSVLVRKPCDCWSPQHRAQDFG
uniref:hypothetical protein n=1 Tax=Streptomyces chartreusis TaxID=1969 RepID=UPI003F498B09